MKETPVSRMNFLRQASRGFTYRSMLVALGGWCALLLLLFGVQLIRVSRAQERIDIAKRTVDQLNLQKEQQIDLIKVLGKKRMNVAGREGIAAIVAMRPRWSRAMRAMTRALPADVWLDGITVGGGSGEEWYTLLITGKAKSQRVLTTFIMQLEASGFFRRTTLGTAKSVGDQGGVLHYEMSTQPVMRKLLEDDEA